MKLLKQLEQKLKYENKKRISDEEEKAQLAKEIDKRQRKEEEQRIEDLIEEEQKEKKMDEEKIIKNKVINKIYKILPQDIICILPENNIIKKCYKDNEIYYNFKDYINGGKIKEFKISIIYTFTGIANIVDGLNKGMSFMVSEIRSEDGLKTIIEEIKNKKKI